MATTELISCCQGIKLKPVPVDKETLTSTEDFQRQQPLTYFNDKYLDTKYEYTDSIDKSLIQHKVAKTGGYRK